MVGLLLAVFGIFIVIVAGSLQIDDFALRRNVVGILSCASLVSMFASPLFIIVSLIFRASFLPSVVGCFKGLLTWQCHALRIW